MGAMRKPTSLLIFLTGKYFRKRDQLLPDSDQSLHSLSLIQHLSDRHRIIKQEIQFSEGVGVNLTELSYPKYTDRLALANYVDPDQMPKNAALDQDLHCLPYIQQF